MKRFTSLQFSLTRIRSYFSLNHDVVYRVPILSRCTCLLLSNFRVVAQGHVAPLSWVRRKPGIFRFHHRRQSVQTISYTHTQIQLVFLFSYPSPFRGRPHDPPKYSWDLRRPASRKYLKCRICWSTCALESNNPLLTDIDDYLGVTSPFQSAISRAIYRIRIRIRIRARARASIREVRQL